MYLGNISGYFSPNNMKKTGLNGYVYTFSVDCTAFDTSITIDIHKYLIKKTWYKIRFELIKKMFLDY